MTNSHIKIKSLEPKDFKRACKLINKTSLLGWQSQRLTLDTIKQLISRNSEEYLANKAKGGFFYQAIDINTNQMVGIIGLRKDEGSDIPNRISTFMVDPEYQQKGIGRMLYQQVKDEAKRLGCTTLVVNSSPYAEDIYKRFGFKKIRIDWKTYDNGDRRYNVWMEQKLFI